MIDPKLLKLNPKEVRLIGTDGRQIGIFSLNEAQRIAEEKKLDLILINEKAKPVVVRLGNYSVFIYQKEKKERQIQKKQKETKEIRISFREAEYDLRRKAEAIKEFLEEGHQVQIRLTLRGRENLFPDLAEKKINIFLGMIGELIQFKVSQPLKKVANHYFIVISKV